MRHQGKIVKLENKQAWVKLINPQSVCAKCGGCMRLTPKKQEENQVLQLDIKIRAQVGDSVIVEYPNNGLLAAVLVLYGIPLLGLFIGYIVANLITNDDKVSGLGAVCGLLIFAVFVRPIAKRLNSRVGKPQIIAKICQN